MEKILNAITKWSIYLSVFLTPIFFLPFTYEPFEFNKQYLLVFLVSIGVLAWLTKMVVVKKEIKFKWHFLNVPILAFLFFAIISTIFSIEKLTSIFGFYGRFSGSLIEIIFLVIFYFLLINNIKSEEVLQAQEGQANENKAGISGIAKSFFASASTAILVNIFSMFGVWQLLDSLLGKMNFHLPTIFSRIFNTIGGSPAALAMFLAVSLVAAMPLFFQPQSSRKKILFLSLITFFATTLLIIIDFTPAWIVLGLSAASFIIFVFWSRIFRSKINWLLIPIILFAISVVFSFFQTTSAPKVQVLGFNILGQPREVILDQPSTWKTALNTIKSYPVLGSGPATFSQDFSKLKPQDFNKNIFWQIRFDRGASQIAEIVMTMGILGLLSWIGILGIFLASSYLLISKIRQNQEGIVYKIPLFFVFLALFIAQFVYYQTVVFSFLFWLILGLAVALWFRGSEKKFSLEQYPEIGLIFIIFWILISLSILGVWFFAGRFYIADIQYKNGVTNGKTSDLEKAVTLNGIRPNYRIILSRAYFSDAATTLSTSGDQQRIQAVQNNFANSIAQAKKVTELLPNWVVGYENLGMIYRDLRAYIKDVSSFAIDSFGKAGKLEPYNPVLVVEIGKLYRDDKNYSEAEKQFNKALSLKPDYDDAKIQLALAFSMNGNTSVAITKLNEVIQASPLNVDGHLQLGIIYYNNSQLEDAITQLQQVLSLSPNNANALYVLGLAYNQKGDKDNALKALNRVLELNPDNKDVLAKISEIQNPPVPEPPQKPAATKKN